MRFSHYVLLAFILLLGNVVHAQITADFSIDRLGGCSPLPINFTNLSTGLSSTASFAWDLGNGNHSALRNPSAIYTAEQTYTVTLTVTDGNQTASKSKTITVYKKPVVDFSVAKPKVCLPASAQFTSSSSAGDGSINNYQWDFGDGVTQQAYGSSINYTYNVEQIATVSLTVTNSYGCQASVTKQNVVEILPRIAPVFTANKTLLCSLDSTVQLTNASTGPGPLQYTWDFGDGATSAAVNPSHQYKTKGLYPIKLTVSNAVGCSATISPLQINAAYFNTDFTNAPLCRQAAFTATSYLNPNNSLWQFGDGGTSTSLYTTLHTYATAGTYNVILINTYNGCKDTVTRPVTVQELVNYNSGITMPSSVFLNSGITFTSTSSTAPTLIKWDFGDGYTTNATNTNFPHSYLQPGTYTVKMTNVFGTCSEAITKTIVINALPNPQGFIANYGGICGAPVKVTFTDTTAGAVAWQWYMDYAYGSSFANTQTAPYNFTSDGYHTVYLTVTNAAGCSRTTSKSINIFHPNATILSTYSSSPMGTNYDCDSLHLRLAVNSNQTIKSYSWNFGNGVTSNSATPDVIYSQAGIYNITLNYVTESGCSATTSYTARVYDKPKANFTYNIPCGSSLNLQFSDISSFSDAWQWNFGDGSSDFGYATPVHSFRDTGAYGVTFINHIGHCADTVVKTVYANVLPSSVSIIKAQNTCDGTRGMVTFDQRSLRISSGTWNFGDGTIIPYDTSAHNITHTYNATGTYQVTLTGKSGNCVLTSVVTVRILLKQSPVLTADKTQICASDALNIRINNLQTNPFTSSNTSSMQWDQYTVDKIVYNTGGSYNGYIDNYTYWNYTSYASTLRNFTAGVAQMRAIISDGGSGCSDTTNYINVQVNGPIAGFKVQNTDLCFKSPFVFTDTSHSATSTPLSTWSWNFGDGTSQNSAGGSTVQHLYQNPGRYLVQLTVTDATGCFSSHSSYVNAKGTKAAFTGSGLYFPNVPLNTTVSFYNNSNSYNTTPNYLWQYGDGATSANYSGSHTYTQAGVDIVKLIVSDASIPCSDTAEKIITVKDFNTAFAFTTSFLGASSCPPVLVRINNLSVGYTNLKWDFGDGTTTTTANYPSHIYQTPGVYKITLYTYGYNGLTGTYVDSIEVKKMAVQISADVLQGCLSQSVNLNAASQNAASYLWDFGDGVVNAGSTASLHAFIAPGIYTPRLIAKDANGCSTAADLPAPIVIDSLSVKIGGIPTLICDSALIAFTSQVNSFAATKLNATLQYQWNFGTINPADTSNLTNPSFRYVTPGTYTVKLRVTSPYGCVKETTATVVVNQKAKGTITALPEICQDGSIQFIGAATPTGNLQWSWNFENGNTAAVQNPPAQVYTNAGNYSVMMVVNKNGCMDTTIHQLTVNPKPIVNALPQQAILCLGNSIPLSAGGGTSYKWTPAIGLNNALLANPMASPLASTLYHVEVSTNKGCVNTDSVTITVAQPIHVQLQNAIDICQGNTVQLNASGAVAYQWINNIAGLNNTNIANPVASPTVSSIYTVVGTDTYSCFKDTARVAVNVRALPTVNAGPDVQLPGGAPYQLNATGSADVILWQWSPAADLSCANCPSPIVTPRMETNYIITVRNQWGCTAADTVLIKLSCAPDHVYFPTAFTPNNDGKNDVFYVMGSGIKIIKYLRIYSRWGDLIYERTNMALNDRSAGWDGKVKGTLAETGTYVYLAEIECSSGELFTRQGTVTLIR